MTHHTSQSLFLNNKESNAEDKCFPYAYWKISNQDWMDERGVAAGLIALKYSLKSHTAVRCLFVASGLEWLYSYEFVIVLFNHL